MTEQLLERLAKHRSLSAAPPPEIEWIANHGVLRRLETGDILTSKQGPVAGLYIVLSGHLTIHVDSGSGRRRVMEWREGDITGMLPYSRLVSPPADVIAEEPTEIFMLDRGLLPQMIQECHDLTAILVHIMLDRARVFTSSYLHDEKMVSLGKLAAGLAHELNNPASALTRNTKALDASLQRLRAASRALGAARLSKEQFALIDEIRRIALESASRSVKSPLEQESHEATIAKWLKQHRADQTAAEALSETDISLEMLDRVSGIVSGDLLDPALCWIASDFTTSRLTEEIRVAATRVYDLVSAVKGFTHMDRASVPEPVDVGSGLSNTVMVLGSKARAKSVRINVNIDSPLPRIVGFGGELNQVWSNLIDNALDAVSENGNIEVSATQEKGKVIVHIVDDGPGIPSGIVDRIFDPFFTTKPIGSGTGLGLDIVNRLILRHKGQIEVESRPGHTEFRVSFPIASEAGDNR